MVWPQTLSPSVQVKRVCSWDSTFKNTCSSRPISQGFSCCLHYMPAGLIWYLHSSFSVREKVSALSCSSEGTENSMHTILFIYSCCFIFFTSFIYSANFLYTYSELRTSWWTTRYGLWSWSPGSNRGKQ